MEFQKLFDNVKEKTANFDASAYDGFLAIQITLKDLDKQFYLEIKDGILTVEPYEYVDRQANLIISSANFVKLINGKLNSVLAFTTGKLKIEGDIGKAGELSNILKKSL